MLKNCQWCGLEFEGRKDARYCKRDHFKECDNPDCVNVFKIREMKRPAKTCSKKCADVLTVLNKPSIKKNCDLCGDEFIAGKGSERFCGKKHFVDCVVCGKSFELKATGSRAAKTCSKKCAAGIVDFDVRNKKSIATNLDKYGVSNPSQLDWVKEKKGQTTLKNYGVVNPSESDVVKKRRENTLVENYGVKNPMFSVVVKENLKKIIQGKYGVANVFQNEDVKNIIKDTMLKKYGVENISYLDSTKEKVRKTTFERFGVESVLMLPENQVKAALNNGNRISKVNRFWHDKLLAETGVDFEFEVGFGDNGEFFADLGFGDVLIDINPSFTHNSTVGFAHATGRCVVDGCVRKSHLSKDRKYHQDRALAAERDGKVLLQLFDWFDEDIFVDIVKSKLGVLGNRVFAKDTVVREISQAEANRFLRVNHLLGGSNGQTVCVGLFVGDDGDMNNLVHVQTFGRSRFDKNVEWEAIRSCSKCGFVVVGGFSKCDKFFMRKYNPGSIVSYIDLATSNGSTEGSFDGWSLVRVNDPDVMWVKLFGGSGLTVCDFFDCEFVDLNSFKNDFGDVVLPSFVSGSAVRRLSVDRVFGFEPGTVFRRVLDDGFKVGNADILLSQGYVKVYGAGRKVFHWVK